MSQEHEVGSPQPDAPGGSRRASPSSDRPKLDVGRDGHARLQGPLTRDHVGRLAAALSAGTRRAPLLSLELSGVSELDSAGAAWIATLMEFPGSSPPELLGLEPNFAAQVDDFLQSREDLTPPSLAEPKAAGPLEKLGAWGYDTSRAIRDGVILAADVFYWSGAALLGRGRARKGAFVQSAVAMGVDALPVILLIAALIGLVMALQSAAQLRQFGAGIYVADLMGIAMAREMGPLMTAIVLAGRSGSSIAAEVATMVVTEETEALRSLGLEPVRFVVVPKFLALTLVTPLLAILATVVGIMAGLAASVVYLGLSPGALFTELLTAVSMADVGTSAAKSVIFAWLIALMGSYQGFRVRGGPEGVGRATTAAVVSSIFAVITADAIAGLIFYFD